MTNQEIFDEISNLEINIDKIDILSELKELCERIDSRNNLMPLNLTREKSLFNNLIYRTLKSNNFLMDKQSKRDETLDNILQTK